MEQFLSTSTTTDVVTFEINVNGKVLDSTIQLLSLSVNHELNKVPVAKLVFRDGDASEQNFDTSSMDLFAPGNSVNIKIGRDSTNTQVFKGIIIKHAVKVKENGETELYVECKDESVRMTLTRHSKYFTDVKDSDIFTQLINGYPGLSVDSDDTIVKYKQTVQNHITDWDFILVRTEANGMLVNVNDGAIKISKPNTNSPAVFDLTFGISVIEFEAEMDARSQWSQVEALSWDFSSQQLFSANSSSVNFSEAGNIDGGTMASSMKTGAYGVRHSGKLIEEELQNWVDGVMLRSRLAKIRGRARFAGSSNVKPGDMVNIQGVGSRFNGNVYVTSVRHDIGKGIWDTHIQFGLDPTKFAITHAEDIYDPLASALIGAINGLQIGKVVQLQDDPEGEDRILVKIPTLDNNSRGIWIRVASLDAGNNRGAFFRPEIDDEVIIGFINNDPRHAVMLGMLNSSAKPAPIKAEDVNNEKGFTTRSQLKIRFHDDDKKIEITTPAGNEITMDESSTSILIQDQNGNSVKMDPGGITMNSCMDINISAPGNINVSGDISLALKSASITVDADASLEMSGEASAQLSSSGTLQVTGTMVMIN